MRVKSRWNQRAKPQSLEEIAGALSFIAWKIATNTVLELENQGYHTESQAHRLKIIAECLIFLFHVTDRLVYPQMTDAERQQFMSALALKMANTYADNQSECTHESYETVHQHFIEQLNQQGNDYAELSFRETEAGFDFLRYFGECVEAVMKEKHWVSQTILSIEGPNAVQTLKTSLNNLLAHKTSD